MVHTDYPGNCFVRLLDDLQNWIYDRVKGLLRTFRSAATSSTVPSANASAAGDATFSPQTGMFNAMRWGRSATKWMQDWRDVQGVCRTWALGLGGGAAPYGADLTGYLAEEALPGARMS